MKLKEWYSPQEVAQYTPDVIFWVLTRLVYCTGHQWPTEPSSSYDAGGKRSRNTSTSFIAVSEACAELNRRLILTGVDGERLEQQIIAGQISYQYVGHHKKLVYSIPYDPDTASAFWYCVGYRTRPFDYATYKEIRKNRHKNKISTFT